MTEVIDRAPEVAAVAMRMLTSLHDKAATFPEVCGAVGVDADDALTRSAMLLLAVSGALETRTAGVWSSRW